MAYRSVLKSYFGFDGFKGRQQEVVEALLNNENVLYLDATGGGKSLTFQLPALVKDGTAIVFTPLISLMKDQVDGLNEKGINAAYINHTLSDIERSAILNNAVSGDYSLLYMAPEALKNASVKSALMQTKINLFAIDEAHTIGLWGTSFRPYYSKIASILKKELNLSGIPFIATTATASPDAKKLIIENLGIQNAKIVTGKLRRDNIALKVLSTNDKFGSLMQVLKSMNQEGAKIIYTGTRKNVVELTQKLNSLGFQCRGYHGGMSKDERDSTQLYFQDDASPIVIATNAFGMGIDRADVRAVIHYQMPNSLEAYSQEIGRAGRDGMESQAVVLFSVDDIRLQNYFIKTSYPSVEVLNKALELIKSWQSDVFEMRTSEFAQLISPQLDRRIAESVARFFEQHGVWESSPDIKFGELRYFLSDNIPEVNCEKINEYRAADQNALAKIIDFCNDDSECKTSKLEQYFSETKSENDCGKCSSCQKKDLQISLDTESGVEKAVIAAVALADQAMSAGVNTLKGLVSKQELSKLLSGISVNNGELNHADGFGALNNLPFAMVTGFVDRLVYSRVLLDRGEGVALGKVADSIVRSSNRPPRTVIKALMSRVEEQKVDESTLDMLRKARDCAAKELGTPPFLIANESLLRKVSNQEVSEDALKEVGIKPAGAKMIMTEYSKLTKTKVAPIQDVSF